MPAFPFGGHPTAQDLIKHAEKHGCHVEDYIETHDGAFLNIRRADGKVVFALEADKDEYIPPTRVDHFCHCLSIPPYTPHVLHS